MAQYIDKDALVAEIERRTDELWALIPDGEKVFSDEHTKDDAFNLGKYTELESLDKFINTLEVKEVDLEEKATQLSQKYFPDEENIWARSNIEAHKCKSACIEMVEWLKAQKGE